VVLAPWSEVPVAAPSLSFRDDDILPRDAVKFVIRASAGVQRRMKTS